MSANHTRDDAFERIFPAKVSCLVDASETYLMALREYLYVWIGEVERALSDMSLKRGKRQQDVEECGEELGSDDGHIGYLWDGHVACLSCYTSDYLGAAKLYRVNIEPYKQSCHSCGKVMVEGRTPAWCELFQKGE